MWEKRRLLIWGTTYPEFSKTYYETVCTGAVDGASGKLVRIYPIRLRYMAEPFSHYTWIEAEVERNPSDFRPESFRIRQESIVVGETLKPNRAGWAARREQVLRPGNRFQSLESLRSQEAIDHTSLGLILPREIQRFYVKRKSETEREEWDDARQRALAQRDFFVDAEKTTKDLRFMPIEYRVEFRCDDKACSGHDCSILDWGLYVLSRREFARGGAAQAEKKVIAWLETLVDASKRDPYFFMGNTKAHSANFMVVGLFHPPKLTPQKRSRPKNATLPLFGSDGRAANDD